MNKDTNAHNESGAGLFEFVGILGGLVIVAVAGFSAVLPLFEARRLEAQAAADIAAANRIMAQGLAQVATSNAWLPVVALIAATAAALAIACCAVAFTVHRLTTTRRQWRAIEPPPAYPPAVERATWTALPTSPGQPTPLRMVRLRQLENAEVSRGTR